MARPEPPREARRRRRAGRWLALVAGAALLGGGAVLAVRPLGPPLVRIASPESGGVIANEAFEVLVQFPRDELTRPETLRVLLNGADVTGSFDVAGNGALGTVVQVVDGPNVLRVGVFGRSWWSPERLVEHTAELRFTVRRRLDADWG